MQTAKRAIAAVELLLIFPAALFMAALFVRQLQPPQAEPAHTAQRIVEWFAGLGPHLGLWVLLCALPLAVLVVGGATLVHSWNGDAELRCMVRQTSAALHAHLATLLVAAATVAAAAVLAIVALHALSD